jgi:hypothetical protein
MNKPGAEAPGSKGIRAVRVVRSIEWIGAINASAILELFSCVRCQLTPT